jgi:hypothetical protein
MTLDVQQFFRAYNPSTTLNFGNDRDRKYYIDFSSVRGSDIIRELGRTITVLAGDDPTCQLFTGHIGCGKSTELLRLKDEMEHKGFHVVYFESSQDLDMADVDISDILLAIARQVSESLDKIKIELKPQGFRALLKGAAELLQTPIELSGEAQIPGLGTFNVGEGEVGFSLTGGIGKLTAKTKDSPQLRSQLRQYLEPRTNTILDAINNELLIPATQQLQQQGKRGLVVIVDNLDRVDSSRNASGRTQPEYLFVDRGEQLRKMKCHVVYTIPQALMFSNDLGRLTSRFGVKPKVLPMVPVCARDGSSYETGMALLRQMVLARAFPLVPVQQRLEMISEVFDSPQTLDRVCQVSGGHVRNLLGLIYGCLQKDDPPISSLCLESVIKETRDELTGAITDEEWELLFRAVQQQNVMGDEDYEMLLHSMFLFEYRDQLGRWYSINPILAEAERFQSWQQTVQV